jgi:hypothetical protein
MSLRTRIFGDTANSADTNNSTQKINDLRKSDTNFTV